MIRTFIFILFFVFILFSFSYAGDIVDVSCPANKPVEVSFEWSSNKDIVVASNNSSFTLPETFVGVYSYFKIPAYSDSTGVVRVVYSSGTLLKLYLL